MLRRAFVPVFATALLSLAAAAPSSTRVIKWPPWLSIESPVNPWDPASRGVAFYVRTMLRAEMLGHAHRTRMDQMIEQILAPVPATPPPSPPPTTTVVTAKGGHFRQWLDGTYIAPPNFQVTGCINQFYIQPFMTGLSMRAVIAIFEWQKANGTTPDPRIYSTVKEMQEWLRKYAWDPAKKAWLEWNRDQTHRRAVVPGAGPVETWTDLTQVRGSLVSFRTTFVFGSDGAVLTSDSTLRFRSRGELADSLAEAGLIVDEVRDAPDRPGLEFVFIARKPA